MSKNTSPAGRFPHVLRTVLETPWAIEASVLAAIREFVELRAAGERFDEEQIQARIGTGASRRDGQTVGSVALLPLYGVITPRADLIAPGGKARSAASPSVSTIPTRNAPIRFAKPARRSNIPLVVVTRAPFLSARATPVPVVPQRGGCPAF